MKHQAAPVLICILIALCLSYSQAASTESPALLGEWSTDLAAAKALATREQKPILLTFSGSDWCHYCKLLKRDIFDKDEWKAYARNTFVLLLADILNDPSSQSKELQAQNKALVTQYKVEGYPTMIVLDSDGERILGKIQYGSGMTPSLFKREAHNVLRSHSPYVQAILKSLTADNASRYRKALANRRRVEKEMSAWLETRPERNEVSAQIMMSFRKRQEKSGATLEKIEIARACKALGDNKALATLSRAEKQLELTEELRSAREELQTWLLSRPTVNKVSRTRFKELTDRVDEILMTLKQAK